MILLTNQQILSSFINCPPDFLFQTQYPSSQVAFSGHGFSVSYNLEQSLVFLCLLWSWHFWIVSIPLANMVEWVSVWVCLIFFHNSGYYFWQPSYRSDAVPFSVHSIRRHLIQIGLIMGHVNLNYLVKVVSAIYVYTKVAGFLFAINKYLFSKFKLSCTHFWLYHLLSSCLFALLH